MAWRPDTSKKKLYDVINNENELIVFDTETTGLNKLKDNIIQISAIKFKIDGFNLIKSDVLDLYINPDFPLPPKIIEITGITDELLEDKPLEDEAFHDYILPFFGENPILAAYNERFDVGFMEELYLRYGYTFSPKHRLDVLEMARDLVDKKESTNHKLISIAKYYGIDENVEFHNALGDVSVTAKCIIIFYNEYKKRDKEFDENKNSIKAEVKSCNYWEKYKIKRVYIETNKGKMYYDVIGKSWSVNKDSLYDNNSIDFEYIREQCLKLTKTNSEEEMVKALKK